MFQVKNNTITSALKKRFQLMQHNYPTNFSKNNFKQPKLNLKITKFTISSTGPPLWKKVTTKETKPLRHDKLFKTKLLIFKNFNPAFDSFKEINSSVYRTSVISWMKHQVTWASSFHSLTNVTNSSVSDVAGVLDSPCELK